MENKLELINLHPSVIEFLDETGFKYGSMNGNPIYYCNSAIIKKDGDKYYLISDLLFTKEVGKDELIDLRFGKKYFQFRKIGHYSISDMKKAFKERKEIDFNKFLIELHK